MPHMSKQTIFASTADFELLLEQKPGGTPVDALTTEAGREAARACRAGE